MKKIFNSQSNKTNLLSLSRMAGGKHSLKKKMKLKENIKRSNKQKDTLQKNYNQCKKKYLNIRELQWLKLNKKLKSLKANLKSLI
jgi:hypothetical protein